MKVNKVTVPPVQIQSAWSDRSKVDVLIQGLRSNIPTQTEVHTPRAQTTRPTLVRNEAVYDFGTPSSTVSESPPVVKISLKTRHRYLDVDAKIWQPLFK